MSKENDPTKNINEEKAKTDRQARIEKELSLGNEGVANYVNKGTDDPDKLVDRGVTTISGSAQARRTGHRKLDLTDYKDYFRTGAIPITDLESLNRRRAENQSTGQQLWRGLKNIPANALVGIVEDIGHMMDLAIGQQGVKDYDNALTQWAKSNRNLGGEVYREDPDKIWDMADPAWWISNGSDLISSIAQFGTEAIVTGWAFGGIGGALGTGVRAIAPSSKYANLIAKGLSKQAPQLANSALLSHFEMARSGASVYAEVYKEALNAGNSAIEANELASEAATQTVRVGTIPLMVLNFGILKPMYNKNVSLITGKNNLASRWRRTISGEGAIKNRGSKLLTSGADETSDALRKRLKGIDITKGAANKRFLRGDNTFTSLGAESFKEGVEEVSTALAEKGGMQLGSGLVAGEEGNMWTEMTNALLNADKTFTEELALNFALGAIGGGGHKFMTTRLNPVKVYKTDAEGKLIPKIGKDGVPIPGEHEKEWTTVYRRNVKQREKIFNKYRNSLITDLDIIEQSQRELETLRDKGPEANAQREEIANRLFDIQSYNAVTLGATDHLIQSFKEVMALDNSQDLAEPLIEERKQTLKYIESIKDTATPEVLADLQETVKKMDEQILAKAGTTAATEAGFSSKPNIGNTEGDNDYIQKSEEAIERLKILDKKFSDYRLKYNYGKLETIEYPEFLMNIDMKLMRAVDDSKESSEYIAKKEEVAKGNSMAAAMFLEEDLRDTQRILEAELADPSLEERYKEILQNDLEVVKESIEGLASNNQAVKLKEEFNSISKYIKKEKKDKVDKIKRKIARNRKQREKVKDGRTKAAKKLDAQLIDYQSEIAKIAEIASTDEQIDATEISNRKRKAKAKEFIKEAKIFAQTLTEVRKANDEFKAERDRTTSNTVLTSVLKSDVAYYKTKEGINEKIASREAIEKAIKDFNDANDKQRKNKESTAVEDAVKIDDTLNKQNETIKKENVRETEKRQKEGTTETTSKESDSKEEEVTRTQPEKASIGVINESATSIVDILNMPEMKVAFGEHFSKVISEYIEDLAHLLSSQKTISPKDEDIMSNILTIFAGTQFAVMQTKSLDGVSIRDIGNPSLDAGLTFLSQKYKDIDLSSLKVTTPIETSEALITEIFNMVEGVRNLVGAEEHIVTIPKVQTYYDKGRDTGELMKEIRRQLDSGEFMRGAAEGIDKDKLGNFAKFSAMMGEYVMKTQSHNPDALIEFTKVANDFIQKYKEIAEVNNAIGKKEAYDLAARDANRFIRGLRSYYEGRLNWDIERGVKPPIDSFKGFIVTPNFILANPTAKEIADQTRGERIGNVSNSELKEVSYSPYEGQYKKVSAATIANKSREFDVETYEVGDMTTALPQESRHKNNAGEEITFEVVDEDSTPFAYYEEAEDGTMNVVQTTWGEYKKSFKALTNKTADYINHVPITIKNKKGELLGYVHQLSFINKLKIAENDKELAGNVAAQRANLIQVRKAIVGGKTKGVITKQGAGMLNISKDDTNMLISEGMSKSLTEPNSLGVIASGVVKTSRTTKKDIGEGYKKFASKFENNPVVFVTAPNGEVIPVIANRLRVNGSFSRTLDANSKPVDNSEMITALIEKAMVKGSKIGDVSPLDLLDTLIFRYSYGKKAEDDDMRSQRIKSTDVVLFVKANKDGTIKEFKFQNERGDVLNVKSAKAFEEHRDAIKEMIGKLTYNVNLEHANNRVSVPVLTDGVLRVKKEEYNIFMSDKLASSARSKELYHENGVNEEMTNVYKEGDGFVEHVYTNNAITDFAVVDFREKERKKDEEVLTSGVEKEELLDIEDDLDDDLGAYSAKGEPQSIDTGVEDDVRTKMLESSAYNIPGLEISEISDAIDFIVGRAYAILKFPEKTKGDLYKASLKAFRKRAAQLNTIIENKPNLNPELKARYNRAIKILDTLVESKNFEKLATLTDDSLKQLGFTERQTNKASDIEEKTMEDALLSQAWDDNARYETHLKDTVSFILKSYFANITVPHYDSNNVRKDIGKKNSLSMAKKYKAERLLIDAVELLHNVNGGAEAYIKVLEESGRHDFIEIARRLKDTKNPESNKLRNAFVTGMTRQKNIKYTTVIKKAGTITEAVTFESNKNNKHGNIVDKWYANQYKLAKLSDLFDISEDTGDITVNTEKLADIKKEVNILYNKIRDEKEDVNLDEIATLTNDNILEPMGIKLEHASIVSFLSNPKVYMKKLLAENIYDETTVPLSALYQIGKSPFNIFHLMIENALDKAVVGEEASNQTRLSLQRNNPLNTKQVNKVLAEVMHIEESSDRLSVFPNAEGNQESIYVLPNLLTEVFSRIQNDQDFISDLENAEYSSNSLWLRALKGDRAVSHLSHVANHLKIGASDAMYKEYDSRVRMRKNMSPEESEMYLLNSYINNNAGFQNKKVGIFHPLVFSDKSRKVVLSAPRIPMGVNSARYTTKETNGEYRIGDITSIDKPLMHALRSIMYGEIKRFNHMADFRSGAKESRGQSADYINGSGLFLLFPELNNQVHRDALVVDGKIKLEDKGIRDTLDVVILNTIKNEINNTISRWYKTNIIDKHNKHSLVRIDESYYDTLRLYQGDIKEASTTVNVAQIAHLAIEYVSNTMFVNGAATQLIGDPAMLHRHRGKTVEKMSENERMQAVKDSWDAYYKRLGGVVGTRMTGSTKWSETIDGKEQKADYSRITYIYANDVQSARYKEEYVKKYNVDGYSGVEVTDAQEFTTLKEHITVLYGQGKIQDNVYNSINQKIIQNYKDGTPILLTPEERINLIPQKPLYTGLNYDSEVRSNYFDYVKSSSIPLIEDYTQGTELDEIRKLMEEKEKESMFKDGKYIGAENASTVRFAFKSAVKSGSRGVNTLFGANNKDGVSTLIPGALDKVQTVRVSRNGFGIQQEESMHTDFQQFPVSQMNKLLFSGITDIKGFKDPSGKIVDGAELKKQKEALRIDLMNRGKEMLYETLGIKENEVGDYVFTDVKKITKFIKEEVEKMGLTRNELEGLQIINGNLAVPLYLNSGYNKMISTLMSTINKVVLRPKMKGTSFVQISNIGINNIKGSQSVDGFILSENYDGTLKYYPGEKDTHTRPQVLVSRDFLTANGVDIEHVTKIVDGKRIIDKTKLDSELLNLVVARIPNQGHNSMLSVEVVGLLPTSMKETMIVPDEISKQMGSDYDIDKVYTYMYNATLKFDGYDEVSEEVYDKLEEDFIKLEEKTGYDSEKGEEVSVTKLRSFDSNLARIGIASNYGLFWNKEEQKYFTKAKNYRAVKTTRANTKNVTKAVIENEYVDIHHSVLTHPEVIQKVLTPLDMNDPADFIKEHGIKEIVDARNAEEKDFIPLGMTYNLIEEENNRSGKDGVAIQSNFSMLMTLLDDNVLIPKNSKGKQYGTVFNIGGNSIFLDRIGKGSYKNENGEVRTNSDVISMLQTEAVDNAKNKRLAYLGYNTRFSGVYNLLTFMTDEKGNALPMEFISAFMLQKSIREAYSQVVNNDSILNENFETKGDTAIINEYSESLGQSTGNPSMEELLKSLKGELTEAEEKDLQRNVMAVFAELFEISKSFEGIYRGLNDETKGVGKDMNGALRKSDIFENYVVTNPRIEGTLALVGHLDENKVFVPNNELGHMVKNGHIEALKVWGGKINNTFLSVHKSNPYLQLMRLLKEDTGNISLTERHMKLLEKGMIDYIMANNNSPVFSSSGVSGNLSDLRQELLLGDNPLNERIDKYLENSDNKVGRSMLEVIDLKLRSNINDPAILKYDSIIHEKLEEGLFIDSFLNLLSGDNKQRQLGIDILRYGVAAGWTFTPVSLSKLIPTVFINNTGMGEYMRNFDLSSVNINVLHRQLVQHHPELAPSMNGFKFGASTIDYSILTPEETETGLVIPHYVRKKGMEGTYVYEFEGMLEDGNAVYRRLANLGSNTAGVKEFDFGNPDVKSIISENNPLTKFEDHLNKGELKSFTVSKPETTNDVGTHQPNPNAGKGIMFEYFGKDIANKQDVLNVVNKLNGGYKGIGKYIIDLIEAIPNLEVSIDHKQAERGLIQLSTNRITLNPQKFNAKDTKGLKNEFEEVLIHEVLHAITGVYAKAFEKGVLTNKRIHAKIQALDNLRESIKKQILETGGEDANNLQKVLNGSLEGVTTWQPLTEIGEFMVGVYTNKKFLEKIKDKKQEGENLVEKIYRMMVNLYKGLIGDLGIKVEDDSVIYKAFDDMSKLLNTIRSEITTQEVQEDKPQQEGTIEDIMVNKRPYKINTKTKEVTTKTGRKTKAEIVKKVQDQWEINNAKTLYHNYRAYSYALSVGTDGKILEIRDSSGKVVQGVLKDKITLDFRGDTKPLFDKEGEIQETVKEITVDSLIKDYTVGMGLKYSESDFIDNTVTFTDGAYNRWSRAKQKAILYKYGEWLADSHSVGKTNAYIKAQQFDAEGRDAIGTHRYSIQKYWETRREYGQYLMNKYKAFNDIIEDDLSYKAASEPVATDPDKAQRIKDWGRDILDLDKRSEGDVEFYKQYGLRLHDNTVKTFDNFYDALKRVKETEKLVKKDGSKSQPIMFKPFVNGKYVWAITRANSDILTASSLRKHTTAQSAIDAIIKARNNKRMNRQTAVNAAILKRFLPKVPIKLVIPSDSQYYRFSSPRFEAKNNTSGIELGHYNVKENRVVVKAPSGLDNFIHETVHAITERELRTNERLFGRWDAYFKEVLKVVEKSDIDVKEHYGFTNSSEFLAELMSNKEFANLLSGLDPIHKGRNLFQEVMDMLINWIFKDVNTLEREALNNAMSVLAISKQNMDNMFDETQVPTKSDMSFLKAQGFGDKDAYMRSMRQEMEFTEDDYEGVLLQYKCS